MERLVRLDKKQDIKIYNGQWPLNICGLFCVLHEIRVELYTCIMYPKSSHAFMYNVQQLNILYTFICSLPQKLVKILKYLDV